MTRGALCDTQDYAGIVERIKAEDPDMIITLATGEAGYNFAQQAADAGIGPQDVPFHAGQVSLESKSYWENVPDGNYAFVQRIGVPENLFNDTAKKFSAVYKERTGKAAVESYAMEAAAEPPAVTGEVSGMAVRQESIMIAGRRPEAAHGLCPEAQRAVNPPSTTSSLPVT